MRLLPLAALLLVGCGTPDALSRYVGRRCTVRVRPDVLGTSDKIPVGLETDDENGAAVAAYGKLIDVGGGWITLEKTDGSTVLVAREHVLSVGVEAASNP